MQLSAFRRFVGKKRLKKLHICRNNNRLVPVFRCKLHRPKLLCIVLFTFIINIAMIFQYICISQKVPKHLGILLNNTGIRNDIDHPVHLIFHRMAQRKRQRCNRLASACRNGQTK